VALDLAIKKFAARPIGRRGELSQTPGSAGCGPIS